MLPARNSFPLCRKPSEPETSATANYLSGQAEPFHGVQAPAEQRLPTSPPHLPNPRSCVTPVRSRQEAVREAFQQILLNWPLGHKTSFFPKPIFQTHVGVLLEGPSRSEPIKTHVWLTVPAAALIPLFWPPAPSFVAPGVGGTLIRGRALRHHISPRPQTFRSRWIRSLKEAGHSWTQLVFSLLLDASELGVPLVRLRPPPAQGCTLSDGRARQWIKGFAKYLAIFSCREEPSVVRS